MIVKKINVDNKINACYIIIPIYLFSRTEYHFFEHCLVTSIKEYLENKVIISGVTKKDNVIIRILFSKVMEEKCFDYLSEDNEEIFKKVNFDIEKEIFLYEYVYLLNRKIVLSFINSQTVKKIYPVYLKQREIYFVTDGKDTLPEKYKNINFLNDSNENYYDSHEDVYEYIMEKIKIPGGLRI